LPEFELTNDKPSSYLKENEIKQCSGVQVWALFQPFFFQFCIFRLNINIRKKIIEPG
jgi:hypothetical protein